MVIPNPDDAPVGVHTADGQVVAYLVPAAELDQMRAELEALRKQIATLQGQTDSPRFVVVHTE